MTTQKTNEQIESIVKRAKYAFDKAKKTGDVEEMLKIRGTLLFPFLTLIELTKNIEDHIKDMKLPADTYGTLYSVKVSDTKRRVLDDQTIFKELKSKGFNPLAFAKVDTKKAEVKEIVDEKGDAVVSSYTEVKNHSFKPF